METVTQHPTHPQSYLPIESLPDRPLSRGVPARPLLGFLPLHRSLPMDLHTLLLDYMGSAQVASVGFLTGDRTARRVSLALGLSYGLASLLSDYRLSLVKAIPIRVH